MKLAAAGLILVSSALVAGCAVYPDGTPAYAGGGYSSYPAYPGGYDPGYYGAPVVQSGVVIGGGYYGGGPGPRWDDGPGYRRPPPGGWGDRGDRGGYRGGDRGGDRGDRGGHGGQQAGGGGPQGGPLAVTADSKPEAAVRKAAARRKPVALAQRHNPNRSNSKRARRTLAVRTWGNLRRRLQNAITDVSPSYRTKNRPRSTCDPGRFFLFCVTVGPQPGRDCARPPFAFFTIRDTIIFPLFDASTDFLHERYEPGIPKRPFR